LEAAATPARYEPSCSEKVSEVTLLGWVSEAESMIANLTFGFSLATFSTAAW
jgi:hypothetical protein